MFKAINTRKMIVGMTQQPMHAATPAAASSGVISCCEKAKTAVERRLAENAVTLWKMGLTTSSFYPCGSSHKRMRCGRSRSAGRSSIVPIAAKQPFTDPELFAISRPAVEVAEPASALEVAGLR